jgi:GAF domain-containing protein
MPSRASTLPFHGQQGAVSPRTERLTIASLWALLAWGVVRGAVGAATGGGGRATFLISVLASVVLALVSLGGQWLARSGRVQVAARLLVVLLYVSLTGLAVLRGTSLFVLYGLLVLTAGLLLGKEMAILTAVLSIVTGLCVADLRSSWTLAALPSPNAAIHWVDEVLALGWLTWLVSLEVEGHQAGSAGRGQLSSRARARCAVSWKVPQLEQVRQVERLGKAERLEKVERRNRYLQAVASISRDTAGLVAEDELLWRCADAIRSHLSFGRVCIYLVNTDGERLCRGVAAEAGNEAGLLREQGRSIDPGSVARRAFRSGSPVLGSESVISIRGLSAPPSVPGEAALPFRIDGRIAGVLELYAPEGSTFGREDVALLQLLADQVAAAIRWARAVSPLRARTVPEAVDNRTPAAEEWGRVLQERRPIAVVRSDLGLVESQDAWRPSMSRAVVSGEAVFGGARQTEVALPIRVRDQVIAVISARKPGDAAPWTEREVTLLEAICAQVGQALENARLYEAVQRREERERLLGQAAAHMRESLDVETVLRVATDEIRRALGLAALEVRLEVDGETDG